MKPVANLWAGAVAAVVFYAEYLGLGGSLGKNLFPQSPTGAATGTLLILMAVVAGTLLGWFGRATFLSGPRGASVAILGAMAAWLATRFGTGAAQQPALLFLLLAGAACTVLAARHRHAQALLDAAPVWLVQGFLYATAAGIVADAVGVKLYGCLTVDQAVAWAIYLPAVLLGVAWRPLLQQATERHAPVAAARWLGLLLPLGLPVAAGLAWYAYEASALALPHGALCARLGDTALDWALLAQRLQRVGGLFQGVLPPPAMAAAFGLGLLLGLVLVIENFTTFDLSKRLDPRDRSRLLAISAAANLAAGVVGASCTSYSTSRTSALRDLGGSGRLSLLAHAAMVAAIAVLATDLVGRVPDLAVAVALTLVGAQMIGGGTVRLWSRAYHPRALTGRLLAGSLFWMVLLVSVATGRSLWGFVAGVAMAVLGWALARRPRLQESVS